MVNNMPGRVALRPLSPRPSVFWGEVIERDGVDTALELVMGRLTHFVANNPNGHLREGWAHLQETQDLIGEIALALRR